MNYKYFFSHNQIFFKIERLKNTGLLNIILLFSIMLFFSFLFCFNFFINEFITVENQQFSYLANSFLHKKLYFLEQPAKTWSDTVFWNNNFYWPLGLFPAIILMPFIFIFNHLNLFFYQGYLQFFLVLSVFLLYFKISKKLNYSKIDSLFLAYAFCFASVFLGVAMVSWSWYFAHVITVFLLSLALYEYFNKKRYWLIGILLGFIALTRLTAGLSIVFFILTILFFLKTKQQKIKNLSQLLIPCAPIISLLFIYNYIRFGNILEQGYSQQFVGPNNSLIESKNYGIFHFKHLLYNIYYSLFSMPLLVFSDKVSHIFKYPFIKSNPWGMSIFLTSPYLIYLFFLKYKDKISKFLLITIILIALPLLFFFSQGYKNPLGFRFALDFMPFLFILFIKNYRAKYQKISFGLKLLIIISSYFNLYLFLTFLY